MLSGFALVALLLAMIGVYGVVAYSVKRRRREIGLRMALGATSFVLTRSFIAPALGLALVGVAIGVSGALLTSGIVSGLLFGITPTDPATLGLVALSLLLTSALAAAIPAQRASRIDPAVAIQNE